MSRIFNFHGSTTLVRIRLFIVEVPRSHWRHTTVGRTLLDEWWARRRNLYLTTHNAQQTNILTLAGFEPSIQLGERPQTHALDRAATGIEEKIIMSGKCELSKLQITQLSPSSRYFLPLTALFWNALRLSHVLPVLRKTNFHTHTKLSYFVFYSLRFKTYDGKAKV
jgi:hypothetical protein